MGAIMGVQELLALDAIDEYQDTIMFFDICRHWNVMAQGVTGAIRRAQSALGDISNHIPEGTYTDDERSR